MYNEERKNHTVCLLYSGGSDSLLSAAILAEAFREVRLITFKHYSVWNVGSSKKSLRRLREKFPKVSFRHVFLSSTALFLRLQAYALRRRGRTGYLPLYFCGACKLAMHTRLIEYCLREKIAYAASGSSQSMSMFPDQNSAGIKALSGFYAENGIELRNPVFLLEDTDKTALEMGLLEGRHLKRRHKANKPWEFLSVPLVNIFDNIQGFCLWIWLVDSYLWLSSAKTGSQEAGARSYEYFTAAIDAVCRRYISSSKKGSGRA